MACSAVTSTCMDGEVVLCHSPESRDSETLHSLAKQLQFYRSPTTADEDIIIEFETVADKNGWCSSGVGSRKRRAAVLVCLFQGYEGELRVILTKRSMNLSSHPGEVALPGGKMDEEDTDESATALREAMEEIGLNPELVQVVANLEPFISQQQIKVVPVVGLLPRIEAFEPLLNSDEVDAVFDVPLEMFLKPESHRYEEREWQGWKYGLHLFDYESSEHGAFLIWGLTASILIRAASLVYQRPPSFCHFHLLDFQELQRALNTINVE